MPQEFTGFNNGFYYQEPFPGVADFDGDGKPDIVVGARSNAYVLHGNGDGTFRDPVSIPIPPRPNAATGDGSVSVATGDFDGDGHKDFAILWGTVTYGVYINGPGSFGEILVYYGKGDGTFAAPVVAAYTNADYVKIMAADLRHDGRDEIVAHASGTLNGGTNVGILLGAANRTFSPITPLVAGYGLSNLQIADLNGDGLPDLVFCNQDYNIEANSATVLLNLGSKPFVTGSLSAQPEPSLVGNPFTLTATFLTPDASTVTGPIAFSVDGNTVGSANLNNNAASVSVPGNYTVGAHTLSAAWAGNTTFDPVTLAGTHTVIAVSTTLSLTSSTNPSVINQPVTFTAQVTAANGQIPTGSVTFTAGGTLISAPVVVNVSPTGTLSVSVTTSALPVGNTAITANYVPLQSGGTFSASAATLTQRVLDGFPSTTTLTSSLNPSTATQSVTFTAQVTAQTAANGTLLGSITFTDGTVTLGTQPLDASGSAIFTTSALSVGAHPILATYFSSNSFASSFSSLTQTVDALPTTALLVASPTTSTYGTAVTLKASVGSSPPGGPALTGTVTFCNTVSLLGKNVCSGTVLGTLPLSAGGTANLPLPSPPAGTSTFGCIYSGDAVYASAVCNAVSVTVNPALTALTLTSSANPSTALTPITFTANLTSSGVPVAQQSLTFSVDGKNLTPVATSAGGSTGISASLTAGAHTIAVTYVATANYAASVAQLTEITTPNGTVTTLSASPTPTYQNQPVTITATVQAQTGAATPDGFVTFYDGSVLLSTFALPPFAYTGTVSTAALTTSTLAPGRHTLTAVYSPAAQPSPNFIASASSPVDITVLPQTFSITLADPTLTIQTEHHRATTVTLTSIGGFNGRVTLACDLLPDYASCTWQNSTLVLLPNGTATTQLVVDTDALLNYKSSVHRTPMPWRESGGLMLAVMAPLIFFRRRRRLSTLLPLALLAALGFFAVGCSSKYPGHTLPGTYGINIKGAGTSAGAVSPTLQSTTMTLVVTP